MDALLELYAHWPLPPYCLPNVGHSLDARIMGSEDLVSLNFIEQEKELPTSMT
jgi:hypothetical protein